MADEESTVIQSQAGTGASAAPSAESTSIDDFMSSRNNPEREQGNSAATPDSAPGGHVEAQPPQTPEASGSEPEGGATKAVKELIGQRRKTHEAEREAAYWRGVAEATKGAVPAGQPQQQPSAPEGPPPKPTIEEYETYEQFEAAKDQWIDDMVDYRAAQIAQRVTQKATMATMDTQWQERLVKAAEANPTLKEAFHEVGTAINGPMGAFIKMSPQGPQVLLYLHQHMEETARLARINPVLAIAELGQIAGRLSLTHNTTAPQPVPISKAPPPVKPVANNGAPVTTSLDKLPIDDFMKERNKLQYGR